MKSQDSNEEFLKAISINAYEDGKSMVHKKSPDSSCSYRVTSTQADSKISSMIKWVAEVSEQCSRDLYKRTDSSSFVPPPNLKVSSIGLKPNRMKFRRINSYVDDTSMQPNLNLFETCIGINGESIQILRQISSKKWRIKTRRKCISSQTKLCTKSAHCLEPWPNLIPQIHNKSLIKHHRSIYALWHEVILSLESLHLLDTVVWRVKRQAIDIEAPEMLLSLFPSGKDVHGGSVASTAVTNQEREITIKRLGFLKVANDTSKYGGALPHLLGTMPSLLFKEMAGAVDSASKGKFVESELSIMVMGSLTAISDS
ncbi:hypothetical protein V2J09_005194 [Rumex salicifolius]